MKYDHIIRKWHIQKRHPFHYLQVVKPKSVKAQNKLIWSYSFNGTRMLETHKNRGCGFFLLPCFVNLTAIQNNVPGEACHICTKKYSHLPILKLLKNWIF